MIEYNIGVTDWQHLIGTIVENTAIPIDRLRCSRMMRDCMETCIEIYKDGKLAGYALIMSVDGQRSFHGYKLIPGNSIAVFRLAQKIMKSHGVNTITTTIDKKTVVRLAQMLGLKHKVLKGNVVMMSRND